MKARQRVGAISHTEGNKVFLFGFGVYVGDEIPGTAAGVMGALARELQHPNPKIVLDSGQVIWGCECWWATEDEVRKEIEGREVVATDIDAARAAVQAESPESP